MARITVEDGLKKIPNRFQLAIASAKRAKQILAGSPLSIVATDNKAVVNSLREIEEGKVRLATSEELRDKVEKQKTEALDALFESTSTGAASSNGSAGSSSDSSDED